MSAKRKVVSTDGAKSCRSCELLVKENSSLKSELSTMKDQYTLLIKETASENFSERRVNLLKAHILHLERQVALVSNGMDTQVQLLSDLQVYGDSLQHKLKSLSLENESLLKDVQHLTKLNKRLKEVPCSKDELSISSPYTGRYTHHHSLLSQPSCVFTNTLRELGWLEGQMSSLHTQLRELLVTLSVLPKGLDTPTLNEVDPIHMILKEANDQIRDCVMSLGGVTQELLTLSLLVPGQSMQCRLRPPGVSKLLKDLYGNKDKGREILDLYLGTLDGVHVKEKGQLQAQEKQINKIQQMLTCQSEYIESIFTELKKGYKSFLSDIYYQLHSPLDKMISQYKTLLLPHNEIHPLSVHIHELHQVVKGIEDLIKDDRSKEFHKLSQNCLKIIN